MTDLKYAIRALARAPGFSAAAILTLALGIGANTAIFSIIYAVLLRPLPYSDPGELVALYESLPPGGDEPAQPRMPIAPPTTRDWADAASFSSAGYYADSDFVLTGAGEPSRIEGAGVSGGFFETLRVPLAAGRPIADADTGPDRPLVCVISHELWTDRFAADPSVIGRRIELSDRSHTVIGVTRPGFAFPSAAQIWTPLNIPENEYGDDQRLSFYLRGIARLAPEATIERAATELNLIANRLAGRLPKLYEDRGATVVPLRESLAGSIRPTLMLVFGTAACVLLIACVNVAGLLMARGASRAAEMATRAALGASRSRLVRHLLTESALLSFGGAAAGVLLAMWARDAIVWLAPASVPRIETVAINLPVLLFALALAALTAVAFGLLPAVVTSRRALHGALAGAGKGTPNHGRHRIRGALVVTQLALSLALLTGAGLLAKTLWNLLSVNPGFDSAGVMTMEVLLPRPRYQDPARRAEFFTTVIETLQKNPVVTSAGGTTNLPLSSTNMSFGFYRQGMRPGADAPLIANVRGITSGYLEALGIPVLRGRDLTSADRAGSPPVVIINDAMRRRFWPDQNPLGQQISITRGQETIWREIVGIAGDIRHAALGVEPEPEIYMPYAHDPFFFLRIAVRSEAPPGMLAGAMQAAVWSVDPSQPVSRLRTMDDVIASSVTAERFNTILIGAFAVLALLLAAVGLYGVMALSVTLRLHEFGVRLALGATRSHVLGLVLRQTMTLAAFGVVLGLAIAAWTTRLVESQLYRTEPDDPITLAAVACILLTVAAVAGWVPARRAVSVDPVRALRAE